MFRAFEIHKYCLSINKNKFGKIAGDVLYPVGEDQSIYYYSLVKRSGVTYSRLKRTVGDHGHWHMNGKRTDIFDDQGNVIGYKTALKFHQADGSSKGLPSEWLMTEFRLNYDNDGDSCVSYIII